MNLVFENLAKPPRYNQNFSGMYCKHKYMVGRDDRTTLVVHILFHENLTSQLYASPLSAGLTRIRLGFSHQICWLHCIVHKLFPLHRLELRFGPDP